MKASDIMTRNVVTVAPDTTVLEIARLLLERHISGVPVVYEGKIIGMVSEGDLVRRSEIGTDRRHGSWWLRFLHNGSPVEFVKTHGLHARDIMTRDVIGVDEATPIGEIADIFETRHIKRVPVLRDGALVGIVSRANLVQALASVGAPNGESAADDAAIRERLLAILEAEPWWSTHTSTVTVSEGIVHFWGLTGPEDDREAARVAAETIPGVFGVQDHRAGPRELMNED